MVPYVSTNIKKLDKELSSMKKKDDRELYQKTITGGYTGKLDLLELFNRYDLGLKMIAYIHYRGTKKYPAFGWYNSPSTCGGTCYDNLNALMRHLGAHNSGFIRDPEGSPHIFHMCCRAGMLVTGFYRNQSNHLWKIESDGDHAAVNWAKFITHEELLSLTKTVNKSEVSLPILQNQLLAEIHRAYDFLQATLYGRTLRYDHDRYFDYDYATPLDKLFKTVIAFSMKFWQQHGSTSFFTPKIIEEDRDWLEMFGLEIPIDPSDIVELTSEKRLPLSTRGDVKLLQPSEKRTAPTDR